MKENISPIYNVRINPGVYIALTDIAEQQGRSITAQVNYMLGKAVVKETGQPQAHKLRHQQAITMNRIKDRLDIL